MEDVRSASKITSKIEGRKITFKRRVVILPTSAPNKKFPKEPTPLGALIQEQIERLGLGKKIKERQAVLIYKDVVGKEIAAVSEATDIRGGKLFVKVSSSTWRTELMYTRHLIAEKINAKLGAEIVKEVHLQ